MRIAASSDVGHWIRNDRFFSLSLCLQSEFLQIIAKTLKYRLVFAFCVGTGRSGAKRTKKQRQRKRAPLPLQKMQDSAQSFFSPNFSSAAALMAMTAPVMPTTEVLTQRS